MAEHLVLYNKDLVRLIFKWLSHPKDIVLAKSICKLWYNIYSLKDIILNIETIDTKLWNQLLIIRSKIIFNDNSYCLNYMDDHLDVLGDQGIMNTDSIILVQTYDDYDRLYKVSSWITAYVSFAHCKNALRYEESTDLLHLSVMAKGLNLENTHILELSTKGMTYQKWHNNGYERNIILTTTQIIDWIDLY